MKNSHAAAVGIGTWARLPIAGSMPMKSSGLDLADKLEEAR